MTDPRWSREELREVTVDQEADNRAKKGAQATPGWYNTVPPFKFTEAMDKEGKRPIARYFGAAKGVSKENKDENARLGFGVSWVEGYIQEGERKGKTDFASRLWLALKAAYVKAMGIKDTDEFGVLPVLEWAEKYPFSIRVAGNDMVVAIEVEKET